MYGKNSQSYVGVSGRSKQWGMLFPGSSRKLAINMSILMNFQSKGFSFVASGATQWNGGVAELVEGEAASRPYTWPDKKKPRVCILGGGFGGLYTALRLESLVWPEDKKPQVVKNGCQVLSVPASSGML